VSTPQSCRVLGVGPPTLLYCAVGGSPTLLYLVLPKLRADCGAEYFLRMVIDFRQEL
jgi:hypothetical protein